MKAFKTSSKRARSADDLIEFTIDDDVFFIHRPKDSSLAYLVASSADESDGKRIVSAVFDFLEISMEPESARLFRKRLLDPRDDLNVEVAMEVFQGLLEEVSNPPEADEPVARPATRRKT